MLTKQQLINLNKLIVHPIYGKLLEVAISTWKIDAEPFERFGVTRIDKDQTLEFFKLDSSRKCCIIGPSIIGKSANERIATIIQDLYDINQNQFEGLILGFDKSLSMNSDKEAYEFGKSVRIALWG